MLILDEKIYLKTKMFSSLEETLSSLKERVPIICLRIIKRDNKQSISTIAKMSVWKRASVS